MENNDSPYIYEKPLRSARTKRSQRLAGLSALGLVGMVGVFGGTALANSFVGEKSGDNILPVAGSDFASALPTASVANNVAPTTNDSSAASAASFIAVPLQSAQPANNSIKVNLPSLPSQSFGNTSSATPTSGSYSGGVNATSSYEGSEEHEGRGDDDHGDREDDGDEDHEREDND